MKKLYISKNRQRLINLPTNTIYYTSLKYRHDKDRKDLAILTKYGYFQRIGRFMFKRTNQLVF